MLVQLQLRKRTVRHEKYIDKIQKISNKIEVLSLLFLVHLSANFNSTSKGKLYKDISKTETFN